MVGCCQLLCAGVNLLCVQVLSNKTDCSSTHCSQPTQLFSKAVILVVDALKYDFCVYNSSLASPGYSQNKLPVLEEHSRGDPRSGLTSGKLFRFLADPPTTTMQRLKGLTTGSLPTFIDVSSNFASAEISEDNIIDQLVNNAKRVVFAGDDTWTSLFPTSFTKSFPQPSFDVWDLDTVDTEVNKVLFDHLKSPNSWDVFIGHFLGRRDLLVVVMIILTLGSGPQVWTTLATSTAQTTRRCLVSWVR